MDIINVDKAVRGGMVRAMIAENAREVVFESVASITECHVCAGSDPFCLTCNGTNRVESSTLTTLSGTVRWRSGNHVTYKNYGVIVDGDCVVTLPHTPEIFNTVRNAKFAAVDGSRFVFKNYHTRGSPPNRIVVTLLQDTKAT